MLSIEAIMERVKEAKEKNNGRLPDYAQLLALFSAKERDVLLNPEETSKILSAVVVQPSRIW